MNRLIQTAAACCLATLVATQADAAVDPADFPIAITELSPRVFVSDGQGGGGTSSSGQFIELYNYGSVAVDLGGLLLNDNSYAEDGRLDRFYQFPAGTTIAPGEFLVGTRSLVDFDAAFPGVLSQINAVQYTMNFQPFIDAGVNASAAVLNRRNDEAVLIHLGDNITTDDGNITAASQFDFSDDTVLWNVGYDVPTNDTFDELVTITLTTDPSAAGTDYGRIGAPLGSPGANLDLTATPAGLVDTTGSGASTGVIGYELASFGADFSGFAPILFSTGNLGSPGNVTPIVIPEPAAFGLALLAIGSSLARGRQK